MQYRLIRFRIVLIQPRVDYGTGAHTPEAAISSDVIYPGYENDH